MAGSGVFAEITDGDAFKFYFEGEWKKSASRKSVSIIIPTTRKTQYKVQACTQEEVNKVMETAKAAQKLWAKTPLWKPAELIHKAAAILKEHKAPIAECLVKEIAKDAVTEVVSSGDLVSYTAEGGVRILGQGTYSLIVFPEMRGPNTASVPSFRTAVFFKYLQLIGDGKLSLDI